MCLVAGSGPPPHRLPPLRRMTVIDLLTEVDAFRALYL